jgi:Bacterial SH3 domain
MRLLALLIPVLLFSNSAVAAVSGTLIRDETLRASASSASATVGTAAKGASVQVLTRSGGWYQITSNGRKGWVRMLSVRTGAATQTDASGELQAVLGLGQERRDPGKVVAVAGVRGLNEEDLKEAKFSESEMRKLEGSGVNADEARRFAHAGALRQQNVAWLPKPKSQKSNSGWGGESSW